MLAVKLQELFGLADTPRIADGRVPLTVHLLSPAGRPLQVTQDLRGFWERTYPEVRKEMKGRYPKHPWPDDPWNAVATHRAKPRGLDIARPIFSLQPRLVACPLTQSQRMHADTHPSVRTSQVTHPMSKLESLSGRALEIAGSVGDSIKNNVPDRAHEMDRDRRRARRIEDRQPRRHASSCGAIPPSRSPAPSARACCCTPSRRQQKKAQNGAIEGKATRIEAKKGTAKPRTRTASSRTRKTEAS